MPSHIGLCNWAKLPENRANLLGFLSAVANGEPDQLQRLPQDFVMGWSSGKSGGTLLHYAANHAHCPETTIPFLVERGLCPNQKNGKGQVPLQQVGTRPAGLVLSCVKTLLGTGARLDMMGCAGLSLMSVAIARDIPDLVDLLVGHGVGRIHPDGNEFPHLSPDVVIMRRTKPAQPALASHARLQALLPQTSADIDRLMGVALGSGYWEWADHWREQGADLHQVAPNQATLLHQLAHLRISEPEPYLRWVSILLEAGLDHEQANSAGQTPASIWQEHAKQARGFEKEGYSALSQAIAEGNAMHLSRTTHASPSRVARRF